MLVEGGGGSGTVVATGQVLLMLEQVMSLGDALRRAVHFEFAHEGLLGVGAGLVARIRHLNVDLEAFLVAVVRAGDLRVLLGGGCAGRVLSVVPAVVVMFVVGRHKVGFRAGAVVVAFLQIGW